MSLRMNPACIWTPWRVHHTTPSRILGLSRQREPEGPQQRPVNRRMAQPAQRSPRPPVLPTHLAQESHNQPLHLPAHLMHPTPQIRTARQLGRVQRRLLPRAPLHPAPPSRLPLHPLTLGPTALLRVALLPLEAWERRVYPRRTHLAASTTVDPFHLLPRRLPPPPLLPLAASRGTFRPRH